VRAILLSLCLACAAIAAPPKAVPLDVSGDTVTVVRSFPCKVTAAAGAHIYHWTVPPGVVCEKAMNVLTITAAPKGEHRVTVSASTIDFDKKAVSTDEGAVVVVVGDVPGPGPKPPDPPAPDPKPIDGPLRVLVVYESAELAKMAEAQQAVIYGRKVRDWLNANCAKEGTGWAAWRMWDKDVDASGESKAWQESLKRPRASVPFVHAFRGETPVHEGPLPADADAMVTLLEKIKGGK
jgi:hypothetical protein